MPPYTPSPQGPPVGGAAPSYGLPVAPKKKRWPWVVGGLLLFCALPLGGCVAFIGIGVSVINGIEDDVKGVVEEVFSEASDGDFAAAASVADAEGSCIGAGPLAMMLEDVQPTGSLNITHTGFVKRDGSTSLSNIASVDEDTLIIDGRSGNGGAEVVGQVGTATGQRQFTITLVQAGNDWHVCTVNF